MKAMDDFEEPSVEGLIFRLGISREAAQIFIESDVIDLHLESYSFYRSFGYHPHKRHSGAFLHGHFVGHADLPRLLETGINGATWVITANPLRPAELREESFSRQLNELVNLLESADGHAQIVRTRHDYENAVRLGKHACFLGIQGANALPPDPSKLDEYAPDLLRITLVHLSDSSWGATSAPGFRRFWKGAEGLRPLGRAFVERMNELRIGVDLAHIHPRGFWDVVDMSDGSLPLLVTHTGVAGAHKHWRNLEDDQLKAVAKTGGVVGIMMHSQYLGDGLFSGKLASVVRHIEHALAIVGDDHVGIGSDWDGMISTPRDMPTCAELPRLVQALLEEGISPQSIVKILGGNFLRLVAHLKGS